MLKEQKTQITPNILKIISFSKIFTFSKIFHSQKYFILKNVSFSKIFLFWQPFSQNEVGRSFYFSLAAISWPKTATVAQFLLGNSHSPFLIYVYFTSRGTMAEWANESIQIQVGLLKRFHQFPIPLGTFM